MLVAIHAKSVKPEGDKKSEGEREREIEKRHSNENKRYGT